MDKTSTVNRSVWLLVVVAAFGYFVDVYDLLLFSAIRTPSLKDIGVPSADSLTVGLRLLNWQMTGLMVGAIGWGILGDKKGRLAVLFGSILTYSIANLLNAYVHTIEQYAWLRLFAGVGLAGELGAGITMIVEVMPKAKRGIGTMIIGAFGLLGAAFASAIALKLGWRTAYIVGGLMGLALLLLRVGVAESSLFLRLREKQISRGNVMLLIKSPRRLLTLGLCVAVGLPVYFIVGLLITGAPEFGKAFHTDGVPKAAIAVMLAYIGMSFGDIVCGLASQLWKSRRLPLIAFGVFSGVATGLFLFVPGVSLSTFYWKCLLVGFSVGFWALINTNTAEQFGTNLRATVATLSPNLIRASLIPISAIFTLLKGQVGIVSAAALVGLFCTVASVVAASLLKETFNNDLDFDELPEAKQLAAIDGALVMPKR